MGWERGECGAFEADVAEILTLKKISVTEQMYLSFWCL